MSRSVLVTGGSSGVGLAVARAFAAAGDRVSVTHRTSPPPAGLHAVRCDVTDAASVEMAFAAVEQAQGPVQVLVCGAGVSRGALMLHMGDADFTEVLDTNLTGAFLTARRACRPMITARQGRIVFVSSASALRGEAGQANHAAAKAGLIGLARSLAREVGTRGVTANVVAPGPVQREHNIDLARGPASARADRARQLNQIPAGRFARAADIAHAVTFLASDAADYINGAVLAVDGGAGASP